MKRIIHILTISIFLSASMSQLQAQEPSEAVFIADDDPVVGRWILAAEFSGTEEVSLGAGEVIVFGTILIIAPGEEKSSMYLSYDEDMGYACPQEFPLRTDGSVMYGVIHTSCAVALDGSKSPFSFAYHYHPENDMMEVVTDSGANAWFKRF